MDELFDLVTFTVYVPSGSARYASRELTSTFGGASVLPGVVLGTWIDDDDKTHQDSMTRIAVSVPADAGRHVRARLARLACDLGEQCLYVTCGQHAAIIDAADQEQQ